MRRLHKIRLIDRPCTFNFKPLTAKRGLTTADNDVLFATTFKSLYKHYCSVSRQLIVRNISYNFGFFSDFRCLQPQNDAKRGFISGSV
jgi:hypothetical protein